MPLKKQDTSTSEQTSTSENEQIRKIIENAWNTKLVRAGIPPRYREAENDLGSRMFSIAVHEEIGAFLYGSTGTGKTYSACAAVIKALKGGREARYITTHELLSKLKDEFNEEKKWVANQISNAWLLVLDEAGEGDGSNWDLSKLFEIINDRYNKMLPTIICSNYSPKELMAKWNVDGVSAQRILSRLSEMCAMRKIEGVDRRRSE